MGPYNDHDVSTPIDPAVVKLERWYNVVTSPEWGIMREAIDARRVQLNSQLRRLDTLPATNEVALQMLVIRHLLRELDGFDGKDKFWLSEYNKFQKEK